MYMHANMLVYMYMYFTFMYIVRCLTACTSTYWHLPLVLRWFLLVFYSLLPLLLLGCLLGLHLCLLSHLIYELSISL